MLSFREISVAAPRETSTPLSSTHETFSVEGAFFGLAFKKYGHPVVAIVIGELIISMLFAGFVALGMPTTINNVVTGATLLAVGSQTVKRVKGDVVK